MSIAKLSIDIEARLANLQAGLDKAGLLAERAAGKIDSSFSILKGAAISLGAGFAAAFTVPALATFLTRTSDGIAALQDMATATGASVENLSALEDAAARTGTNFDAAGDAVIKMNKALSDAKPGSEQASVFKALNLDIKELKALDPAQAFHKISKALADFQDDGNKARAVQVLFGKSLKDVAPLLADMAEQTGLTATLTAAQVAEAKKFNDQLASLEKSAVDASRSLAGPFIGALNALIEKYRETRKEGKGFFASLFSPSALLEQAAKIGAPVQFSDAAGAGRGFVNPPVVKPSLPDSFGTSSTKAAQATKAVTSDLQKYIDTLIAAQVATLNLSTEEQARYDIANGKLGKLSQAQQQQVIDLARGVDLMKTKYVELEDAQSAFRKSELAANEATNEAMAQATAALDAQLDAFSGRTADMIKRMQTARLEARINAGEVFSPEELDRIVAGISGITPIVKAQTDEWTAFAEQSAHNIQDALGDTLVATLSGNFENVGQLWKNLLIRMASEAAAAQIGKELFGDFGQGGKAGIGGSVGDVLKLIGLFSANGNAFSGGAHAFAEGGILGPLGGLLERPTVFPMANGGIGLGGEAGTEAVMPLARGRNGKLGVQATAGGGRSVALTYAPQIRIDARSDQAQVAQLVAAGVQQGQQQMLDRLKASGVLQ